MTAKKEKDISDVEVVDMSRIEDLPIPENKKQEPKWPKRLWKSYIDKKKITFPLTFIILALIIFAIPYTRYKVLGIFIKRTAIINVYDSQTNKPVSEADILIDGKQAKTDGNGQAKIENVKVGYRQLKISKKFYTELNKDITIKLTDPNSFDNKLTATGRQVPVSVGNLLNSKSVKGASIKSQESAAITDDQGNAVIVTDPTKQKVEVTVQADNYNLKTLEINVTDEITEENKIKLTPAGKIYFVSKQSGKNDVVESNLDGTERKVIVSGTGKEQDDYTILSASRDWRYISLFANREDKNNTYIIDVKNPELQETQKEYRITTPIGWYDQYYIYYYENDGPQWQSKNVKLVSYDAENRQNITLDENRAEGTSDIDYVFEQYTTFNIVQNEVVYSKVWYADLYSGGKIVGKQNSINSINPGGFDKKTVKEFDAKIGSNFWIDSIRPKPQILNFRTNDFTQQNYYEYKNNKLTEKPQVSSNFTSQYPKYIYSPSGNKTFWSESRDGKNVLIIGDKDAENTKQIADKSEYVAVGWYTDDYLLLSKNGSELYISDINTIANPIKVSDFQPNSFNDLGGGYSYVIK